MSPLTLSRQQHHILVESLADRAAPLAKQRSLRRLPPDPDDVLVVHDFLPGQRSTTTSAPTWRTSCCRCSPPPVPPPPPATMACEEQQTLRELRRRHRPLDGRQRAPRLAPVLRQHPCGAAGHPNGRSHGVPHDFIADFRGIYWKAAELIAEMPGDQRPRRRRRASASCRCCSPSTRWAPRRGNSSASISIRRWWRWPRTTAGTATSPACKFVCADILAGDLTREFAPLEPGFDVVTAIHLLEHLTPGGDIAAPFDNLWALTAAG